MKRLVCLLSFGVVVGGAMTASAAQVVCPIAPPGGGGESPITSVCPRDPPEREPNRLAGPDGNPSPTQTRCGENQFPGDCPAQQNLAYNGGLGCINGTEYRYAQSHALAPLCSAINPAVYIGFCYCGCLERSTGIVVFDPVSGTSSSRPIDRIEVGAQVQALTEAAMLSALQFAPRGIEAKTVGGEKHPMVVLEMAGGARLAATENHAILLTSGMMVAAKDLQAGQTLVRQDGSPSVITAIARVPTDDDVYNVLTDAGLVHQGHLIVAGGLIVGDLMWQSTLVTDLNAIIVRQ